MCLDDLTASDFHGANAAVVRALRCGEVVTLYRPTEGATFLEEGVLLLDTHPHLVAGVLLGHRNTRGAGVGRVWLEAFGEQHVTKHQLVVAATNWIWTGKDRPKHAVGVGPWRLVRRRTVEAPHFDGRAILQDSRLRTHEGHRVCAVNPDVLSPVGHVILHSAGPTSRPGHVIAPTALLQRVSNALPDCERSVNDHGRRCPPTLVGSIMWVWIDKSTC